MTIILQILIITNCLFVNSYGDLKFTKIIWIYLYCMATDVSLFFGIVIVEVVCMPSRQYPCELNIDA